MTMTSSEASGRNQVLYREVNEHILEITSELFGEPAFEVFCECGEADCSVRIEVTVAAYEAVRARATHFIVVAGHEDPDVKQVVSHRDGYLVVENVGRAAEVAEQTNPRR